MKIGHLGKFKYCLYFLPTNFYTFPNEANEALKKFAVPRKHIYIWEKQLFQKRRGGAFYKKIYTPVFSPPTGH